MNDYAPRERKHLRLPPQVYAAIMICIQFGAVVAVQYGLIRLALHMYEVTP